MARQASEAGRVAEARQGPWLRRLHVVTGKGGTGKTTVASALALALATGGQRVLLTEVEGRQQIAQVFDTPPLAYRERRVASAPGGGEVYALAVDAEEALLEYLEMFYNLRGAGKVLGKIGAIDFATTIAPGVRDVLLTGKIKEAVNRPDGTRPSGLAYDAVVLDAPPTGRVTRFLNVAHEVAGLAKMGPIRSQADGVLKVLHSGQTAVHLVTLLEEMPVQETVDAVEELRAANLPVGAVVVNMIRPPMLGQADLTAARAGTLDLEELAAGIKETGVEPTAELVGELAREAAQHAERVALEAAQRIAVEALDRPVYELPLAADGMDMGMLYRFAEMLRAQRMVA
ncbi:ArsA-related P-loop ATPase [Pseudofrankia inefficax]|uniref:Putative ion-transporting ATPase n=1 Tax=Pseudofrankia inefficax (strain DSM 45817 / CECT 9037 / DDB 130130 / EuI1c) TaxID=298654 RepID=E3J7F6_PSEI1|nr:putative ion-transporting ATPase [Pseudofrankia inefficax]